MEATVWSLVPPLLAIVVSLITKEVNLSLLVGIVVGAGLLNRFDPFASVTTGLSVMGNQVYNNLNVLIFVILLGMLVHLMNLSGATEEYAKWASKRIHSKRASLFATTILGIVIFIDDYFNCLTVGTVMRPITDRNKVSREKLAYIIDSTAAPVCMVAPISSWAAAVSSSISGSSSIDGFQLFLKTIPYNFYTWFTLFLIILTTALSVDFGKMKEYEKAAESGNYRYESNDTSEIELKNNHTGKVIDLLLPVLFLIIASIVSMLYTGKYFDGGVSIAEAFANCNAITALAMGAAYSIVFLAVLYLPRKIVTPKQFLDGLVEGFKFMVPSILILAFAWTLGGVCGADYLNAGGFVANVVSSYHINLSLLPAAFFAVSLALAFSTGTSWGTFAIMLPITVSVFSDTMSPLLVATTAAVLGGSVMGDHISPISDTTILSSTGAQCKHVNHVATQLQYGAVTGITAFICYLIAGKNHNPYLCIVIGFAMIFAFTMIMKQVNIKEQG